MLGYFERLIWFGLDDGEENCETNVGVLDKWSPALQIRTVLLSIQALLSAPNPDDPLANDVAQHWKENEKDAINTGRFLRFCCGRYYIFTKL